MNLQRPKSQHQQDGFAMIQVMVAMAILGILVVAFSGMIAQTVKAQRIARAQGEKLSLQSIFRGSLTCTTSCTDLKRGIPEMIGKWKVQPVCSKKKLTINVSHPDLYAGNWSRLYKVGQEDSVCKNFVRLGPGDAPSSMRRRVCPTGKKVKSVNFAEQSIECY
jgi:hypothetical protein